MVFFVINLKNFFETRKNYLIKIFYKILHLVGEESVYFLKVSSADPISRKEDTHGSKRR